MALIVEVRGPDGVLQQRVEAVDLPITIGRALDNRIVLDDPFVDAHHAQLERTLAGELLVRDLDSLNKLASGGLVRLGDVAVAHGSIVTLGQTVLRFLDAQAPVEPPLPLPDPAAELAVAPVRNGPAWYERWPTQVTALAAAMSLVGAQVWFTNFDRGAAPLAIGAALVAGLLMLAWSGAWSLLARSLTGQFRYRAILVISTSTTALDLCLEELRSWAAFLLPDNQLAEASVAGFRLTVLAVTLGVLLVLSTPLARRWCGALGVVGALVLFQFGDDGAWLEEDGFTAVATFASEIRALDAAYIPTDSDKALHGVALDLKEQVDELIAEADEQP
jgi:hypothetical protein